MLIPVGIGTTDWLDLAFDPLMDVKSVSRVSSKRFAAWTHERAGSCARPSASAPWTSRATPCASGLSPTKEEFEEAKRRNKPIVVLRQEVEMEPEQRKFLTRSTDGSWDEGSRPSATPLLQRAREIRRWLGIRRTASRSTDVEVPVGEFISR